MYLAVALIIIIASLIRLQVATPLLLASYRYTIPRAFKDCSTSAPNFIKIR
ncbi:hypothetical protein RR48_04408 [Papilio machaon]|uniref:Uncharacterized protein n=1 Tax=Papilio machaon TaxID=76193 RepID=A0A0N0PCC5_PAPMA|nr:hypothetical protein RR48_04408 [Papilio machaon]